MIYQTTETVAEAFRAADIHCRIVEGSASSWVEASVEVDDTSYEILFISRDDKKDLSVRIPNFVRFRDADYQKVMRTANRLNNDYRYCKFTVNPDHHCVTYEYDLPVETADVGKSAVMIFRLSIQIADRSFGEFMKTIWGGDLNENFGNVTFYEYKY